MTTISSELLAAHALGALSADEAVAVERALDGDAALREELAELLATTAELAAVPAAAATTGSSVAAVRARLFEAAERPRAPGLFERFGERFAAIFDVTMARARELIGLVDDPLAWEPGPGPGSWLIHFEAGPACAGADTGFVKLAPGVRFPWHRHDGHEHSLILAGAGDDTLNGRSMPGDEPTADGATEHEFTALGDEPYLFAVRVFGVDFTIDRPADRA